MDDAIAGKITAGPAFSYFFPYSTKGLTLPRGRGKKTPFGQKWLALEIASRRTYREAGEASGLHEVTVRRMLRETFCRYFRQIKAMDLENTRNEISD